MFFPLISPLSPFSPRKRGKKGGENCILWPAAVAAGHKMLNYSPFSLGGKGGGGDRGKLKGAFWQFYLAAIVMRGMGECG